MTPYLKLTWYNIIHWMKLVDSVDCSLHQCRIQFKKIINQESLQLKIHQSHWDINKYTELNINLVRFSSFPKLVVSEKTPLYVESIHSWWLTIFRIFICYLHPPSCFSNLVISDSECALSALVALGVDYSFHLLSHCFVPHFWLVLAWNDTI